MDRMIKRGTTGVVLRIQFADWATDGLSDTTVSVWAAGDAAPTVFDGSEPDLEAVAVLGTYQAPSSGKARVGGHADAGFIEVHLADAWFEVAGDELCITVDGTASGRTVYTVGISARDVHNGSANVVGWVGADVEALAGTLVQVHVAAIGGGAIVESAFDTWAITQNAIAPEAITAATFDVGAIDAAALDQSAADLVWASATRSLTGDGLDAVQIDGHSMRVALQWMAAILCGEVSGAGTGTEVFVGIDDATTRVTVTVDASGNRSVVTRG